MVYKALRYGLIMLPRSSLDFIFKRVSFTQCTLTLIAECILNIAKDDNIMQGLTFP